MKIGENWLEKRWGLKQMPFDTNELDGSEFGYKQFVGRKEELKRIINLIDTTKTFREGIRIGVCGVRGIGKTSLMNIALYRLEELKPLIIKTKATAIFSKVEFLNIVIDSLCESLKGKVKEKATLNRIKEIESKVKFAEVRISEGIEKEKGFEAKVSSSLSAFLAKLKGELSTSEFNLMKSMIEGKIIGYPLSQAIRDYKFLVELANNYYPFVIISMDEFDKWKHEEAKEMFNSIKPILLTGGVAYLIALDELFFDEFSKGREITTEESILTNLFSTMVLVEPFKNPEEGEVIIKKRLEANKVNGYKSPFNRDTIHFLFDFSRGITRSFISYCLSCFTSRGDLDIISVKDAIEVLTKVDRLPSLIGLRAIDKYSKNFIAKARKLKEFSILDIIKKPTATDYRRAEEFDKLGYTQFVRKEWNRNIYKLKDWVKLYFKALGL